MTIINIQGHNVNPALVVIDVQNGFVSKGGHMTNLRWMYPIISVSYHEYLNSSAFAGASIYLYFILRLRKIWHRSFNKYS